MRHHATYKAHRLLDAAQEGKMVRYDDITEALKETGDIPDVYQVRKPVGTWELKGAHLMAPAVWFEGIA